MKVHLGGRAFLVAAVVAAAAVLVVGFFAILGVRSGVAGPDAAPAAAPANPGHPYSQIDLPVTGPWTGLDADLLDSQHASAFASASHNHNASDINAGTLSTDRYSAVADLTADDLLGDAAGDLAQNNGTLQATLNADLLDGLSSSAFAGASHNHSAADINAGTLSTDRYGAYSDLSAEGYLGNAADDLARNNGAVQATLNADLLDTQSGAFYQNATNINAGTLSTDRYDAHSELAAAGYLNNAVGNLAQNNSTVQATLNADLLDSQSGAFYQDVTNINAGTLNPNFYSAYADLGAETYLGNAAGDLAQNNGTVQSTLNADLLDGLHAIDIMGRLGFSTTTVDSAGNVGTYTSVTLGADGLPIVSYYDANVGNLKVAHCGNAACSASTVATVDTSPTVGLSTSVTVGTDGLPLISYYDMINHALKVAHCGNPACSASNTITTLESGDELGLYTSVTVGADGLGLISYHDAADNDDLKVSHCSNTNCTASTITIVDSGGDVGRWTSVTVGADGLGLISYYDVTNGDLKVAHCSNATCSASTVTTVDSGDDVGMYTSVTLGVDGLPLISYYDNTNDDLKVAHCSNATCSASTVTTADSSANEVGLYTSVTVGSDGLPLISYYDNTNDDLKVAHCSNLTCTASTITTVATTGLVGMWGSVTVGADGVPVISYYDDSNDDLKVAHCSNRFCVPYHRPR